jgi:hypothetical protein
MRLAYTATTPVERVVSETASPEPITRTRSRNASVHEPETDIQLGALKDHIPADKRDPLAWFGVLVPPALRTSQQHFKNSLLDVVAMANLRTEILARQAHLSRLLAQKKDLVHAQTSQEGIVDLSDLLHPINYQ